MGWCSQSFYDEIDAKERREARINDGLKRIAVKRLVILPEPEPCLSLFLVARHRRG